MVNPNRRLGVWLVLLLVGGCTTRDFSDDTGTLNLLIRTTGDRPDPDGYLVISTDSSVQRTVSPNGTFEVEDLPEGNLELTLTGLENFCVVLSPNPQPARIEIGQTAEVLFEVNCIAVSSTILFETDRTGNLEIFRMNPNGSNPVNLTRTPSPDFDPTVAADGSRLAFTRFTDGATDIFIADPDGSNPVNLTRHSARDFDPALSPDGRQLAFVSDRDGGQDLYRVALDGSDPVRLTQGIGVVSDPVFDPVTGEILFTLVDGTGRRADLVRLTPAGPGLERLTASPASDFEAVFSPDGQTLVFVSDRDGNPELYRMNPDGSDVERLTDTPEPENAPAFSPDGTALVFVRTFNNNAEVRLTPWPSPSGNLLDEGVNLTRDGAFDYKPVFLSGGVP